MKERKRPDSKIYLIMRNKLRENETSKKIFFCICSVIFRRLHLHKNGDKTFYLKHERKSCII